MKKVYTTICFFTSLTLYAQSPGGVTGPTFWLKANAGTATTTNNAANASWVSQGSVAATLNQGTAANRPLYKNGSGTAAPVSPVGSSDNIFNYNPYLFFDGTNDNLFSTTSYDLGSASTGMSEFGVVRPESGIVFFEWNGPNAMVKCKSDGPQCLTDGFGSFGTNNQYNILNNTLPKIQHMVGLSTGLNATIGANGFVGYDQILVPTLVGNNNPSGSNADRTNVGCNVNTGEFTRGGVTEIILYNRIITATEQLRINSYLAIKFGITLGGAGSTTNYLRSDGTTIWTSVAAYHNKVIGIGRDDNSALIQKQSHQDDDSVRIYRGTLAATNAANGSTFAVNNSFVMMGSNTGKLCATTASNSEMPAATLGCTLNSRLEREWRVTKTNMNETFNMDIKLASCANLTLVNVADLRLLVDDDGNFSNGGTQCYFIGDGTGINFSYTNPLLTITGISSTHIPNNATRFITVASVNPLTPLPVDLLSFEAKLNSNKRLIDINWTTESELNTTHFKVEKIIGNSWTTLETVSAIGSGNSVTNYHIEDLNPLIGENYFRLKSVDNNGEYSYSDIRVVLLDADQNVLQIFPNPANNLIQIVLKGIEDKTIQLFDASGRLMECPVSVATEDMLILNLENISSGVYTLKVEGNETLSNRIIIQH